MNTEQLARMTVADIGDPLDYAHKAARGDIPTESEQMFRHARAQIQSALMLLDAGMFAKAAYHAQGGMALCDSLAKVKQAEALRNA